LFRNLESFSQEKLLLIWFFDHEHDESDVPIRAPFIWMIDGLLLNGKKSLVPPKKPGFQPRESLFGISLMTRSTDLNLNR
jgi:hypothetical protein